MGAVICINKMPENCRKCPFSSEDKRICMVRKVRIIAWEWRDNRMPLCPLENEGEYFTRKKPLLKHWK